MANKRASPIPRVSLPARFWRPCLGEDEPLVKVDARFHVSFPVERFAYGLAQDREGVIPYLQSVLHNIGTRNAERG